MVLASRLADLRRIFECVCLALLLSSCASAPPAGPGLVDGKLALCPATPNCVCSEESGTGAPIDPLSFGSSDPGVAWVAVQDGVKALGGTIETVTDTYLWATFSSRIFRFVDDVELRLDSERGVVHIRSASRLGYSDFGVNRKRIESLRKLFASRMGSRNGG
ncbi:MAG: hypothetical protein A2X84_04470 [Desulfuromonadaceae bacterium GWC2_58_13]|nr:MAG: hypothetical protein A2X84_04470 [Desulfuromonadaceae bacterium GWC2_58_13]